MPRKPCNWTRKLELELVEFVKQREFIWKPIGNTNHHILQKYKAYAEFAANLGRGFTARSVRDRWVNIRTTFNHNLRRVDKSKCKATSTADVYVPCWPLWKPLQFLREVSKKEEGDDLRYIYSGDKTASDTEIKEESHGNDVKFNIRQRLDKSSQPTKRSKKIPEKRKNSKCVKVLNDLVLAMSPFLNDGPEDQKYWFFGRHVTEQLNMMRTIDAECASREILLLLNNLTKASDNTTDSAS